EHLVPRHREALDHRAARGLEQAKRDRRRDARGVGGRRCLTATLGGGDVDDAAVRREDDLDHVGHALGAQACDPATAQLLLGGRTVDDLGADDIELPGPGQVAAQRARHRADPAIPEADEEGASGLGDPIGAERSRGWLPGWPPSPSDRATTHSRKPLVATTGPRQVRDVIELARRLSATLALPL